jgi:hypothetical protein
MGIIDEWVESSVVGVLMSLIFLVKITRYHPVAGMNYK